MNIRPDLTVAANSEQIVAQDLIRSLRSTDVFYDVGANFGRYSCLVGAVHPEVNIIAFEPNPEAVSFLRKNLNWNRVRARVLEIALSSREEIVTLDVDEGPERARISIDGDASARSVQVQTSRLDRVLESGNLLPPSVLKLDVEGAELKVLEGMEKTLRSDDFRLLYCEVHPHLMGKMGDEAASLYSLLSDVGLEVQVLSERKVEYADGGREIQKFIRAHRAVNE